jgi:hypothetical protein
MLVTRGGGKVPAKKRLDGSKTKEFRFSFTTFNKVHNVNEFDSRPHHLAHAQHADEKKGGGRRKRRETVDPSGDMMYFWGFRVILDIFNLNIIESLLPSLSGRSGAKKPTRI